MRIDQLWKELEAEAMTGAAGRGGWLLRLAKAEARCPLFVAIDLASRRRTILLRLPAGEVPLRRHWPRSKGLEPLAVTVENESYFGVALKEGRFADVFTALAEDLARRVGEAADAAAQARALLGQLGRWQRFLSVSSDGLSDEAQRGLWGELHILGEHLLPAGGCRAAATWVGGQRAHQDFQAERWALEVKTTLAKQPQVVRITSERQLDAGGWSALILVVVAVDQKDGGGETLPRKVAALRTALTDDGAAREAFEEQLLATGYLDAHGDRYSSRGYVVRSTKAFRVDPGFPCLVEAALPSGIGDVSYGVSVASCEPFNISLGALRALFIQDSGSGTRRSTHG